MGTISARLPEDIENELELYLVEENLERSTAVRKLLTEGLASWRENRALTMLREGDVTISRGAEIADCSVWEFARLAESRDITWISEDHLEDDLDDL